MTLSTPPPYHRDLAILPLDALRAERASYVSRVSELLRIVDGHGDAESNLRLIDNINEACILLNRHAGPEGLRVGRRCRSPNRKRAAEFSWRRLRNSGQVSIEERPEYIYDEGNRSIFRRMSLDDH